MKKYKLRDMMSYLSSHKNLMSKWALKLFTNTQDRLSDQEPVTAKQYAKIIQETKNIYIEKNLDAFHKDLEIFEDSVEE